MFLCAFNRYVLAKGHWQTCRPNSISYSWQVAPLERKQLSQVRFDVCVSSYSSGSQISDLVTKLPWFLLPPVVIATVCVFVPVCLFVGLVRTVCTHRI